MSEVNNSTTSETVFNDHEANLTATNLHKVFKSLFFSWFTRVQSFSAFVESFQELNDDDKNKFKNKTRSLLENLTDELTDDEQIAYGATMTVFKSLITELPELLSSPDYMFDLTRAPCEIWFKIANHENDYEHSVTEATDTALFIISITKILIGLFSSYDELLHKPLFNNMATYIIVNLLNVYEHLSCRPSAIDYENYVNVTQLVFDCGSRIRERSDEYSNN